MKQPKNPVEALEERLCRSPGECARVLGVAYSTYQGYSAGSIPQPMRNHIDVIMRLPLDRLHELVCARLTDG
jgi:hypothetical protein